ncbi:MAG TPA: alpha-amylase/alpha-mannosidase [Candidatus Hypogeohydataceae bacterium YC41]
MINLAFLWHFHQPFYKDLSTGEYLMPWVRLHAIKGYIGMGLIAKEFPEIRQNFNFVPCLLVQLEEYAQGKARDKFQKVSELDPSELLEKDIHFLLDNFFSANWERMIEPYPRYRELLRKRSFGKKTVDSAAREFNQRDLRDLQVWANLTWFHPLVIQRDKDLQSLFLKDHSFTEEEKRMVLNKQIEVIAETIKLYRELEASGQIETTTSPFYHAILPLLCEPKTAQQALPNLPLPKRRMEAKEDAAIQVHKAVETHERFFNRRPKGFWPSEGAVSPHIVPILQEANLKWMASDEDILARTLHTSFSRDQQGVINQPQVLYKPYCLEYQGSQIQIIFRDHRLSDLIGFEYQKYSATAAGRDFVKKIEAIKGTLPGGQPMLVSIILDGENPWEYYPNSGMDFLRELYRGILQHKGIETIRISDYLERYPPRDTLHDLYAGSWIYHNLATWIGHSEKNRAWEYLAEARDFLKKQSYLGGNLMELARECIYISEGSDWYWWYGDDHSSFYNDVFDRLFRTHLKNVYKFSNAPGPRVLDLPISQLGRKKPYTTPKGFLRVRLDGRVSSFLEWVAAGHYRASRDTPVMHRASGGIIREVYYGFDEENFLLRVDFEEGALERFSAHDRLVVIFLNPSEVRLQVAGPLQPIQALEVLKKDETAPKVLAESAAAKEVLELRCPFREIGFSPEENAEFLVEIERDGQVMERLPDHFPFAFTIPTKDFERILWQV